MISTEEIDIEKQSLSEAIQEALNSYNTEVSEAMRKEVDKIANETRDIVKEHAPVRTGEYKKSIIAKKGKSSDNFYYKIVANTKKMAHLSHLLEYKHLTRDGTTYSRAFPHFKYGQDFLEKNYEARMEEVLKKIK